MPSRSTLRLSATALFFTCLVGFPLAHAHDEAKPSAGAVDKGAPVGNSGAEKADCSETDAALPKAALEALAAFRNVPWKDRLKPAHGEKPPENWDVGVRTEWLFGALDGRHRKAVEALLQDKDRFVRALAARTLGIQGDAKSAPALIAALGLERDPMTIRGLIQALARTGGDGALAAIEKLQKPGIAKDVQHHIGLARRQLKGGKWELSSLRGENAEGARMKAVSVAKKSELAPELGLPSPDGPVNLSVLRDNIVILAFVHGDRGPKDNKVLARLALEQAYFDRHDVKIVIVAPHEKERTQIWRQKGRHKFKIASDPVGRGAAKYGLAKQLVSGSEWLPSPAWFILDRKGKLVWQRIGTKMGDHASLGELMPVIEDLAAGVKVD